MEGDTATASSTLSAPSLRRLLIANVITVGLASLAAIVLLLVGWGSATGMTPVAALAVGAWLAASPLPVPRTEVAAAPLQGRIVVVGGFLANGGNSRRVDAYDPRRDAWMRLPDLPTSVDHAAAASWSWTRTRPRRPLRV